jgi:Tol biopolymer transport system component
VSPEVGACFGPYEIAGPLGSGGMGEVYRARDTRLDREVAIKLLPAGVTENPGRRARFEREARVLAQLSHPHICSLYDAGEEHGAAFLVMEHIDGESLEQRLRRGPIPYTTALTWAIQIASALDAAHRRGIVHRDLKPANIMVAATGIKLVDFGVAKLIEGSEAALAFGPASTVSLTAEQRLVGTVHHMAPEQLEGRDVDGRADVFALGVTLYQMLTGRKPFDGASAASVTAAILTTDPPPPSVSIAGSATVPASLDHVIRRTLAKNPEDRWQTARDLGNELRWVLEGRAGPPSKRSIVTRPLAVTAATVLFMLAGAWAVSWWRPAASLPPTPPIAFTVEAPPGMRQAEGFGQFAVSPDGRHIAFAAGPAGRPPWLWVRSLDSATARQLPGTEGASSPFWSPDSRSIGFYADSNTRLARVVIAGGLPIEIVDIPQRWHRATAAAMWLPDDTVVFGQPGGLFRVAATGGEPVPISLVDEPNGERGRAMPAALPLGRFLYLSQHTYREAATYVQGENLRTAVELPVQSNAVFAAGHLLFRQGQSLVAQRFDPEALKMIGRPVLLAQGVSYNPGNDRTAFAASERLLAYVPETPRTLTWRDRQGRPFGSIGEPGRDWNPVMSPDGSTVAVDRYDPATQSFRIWTIDTQGRQAERTHGTRERFAVWSPDGGSIVYFSVKGMEFRRTRLSGNDDELLFRSESEEDRRSVPLDWSSDGRFLIFQAGMTDDLWALALNDTKRTPLRITNTAARETSARLSPDARWIAFTSNEGGEYNVWVQEFPTGASKRRVSVTGGMDPSWRADGRELFYLASDGTLTAVPVSGPKLTLGDPAPLFRFDPGASGVPVHYYAASPDGQRFLTFERAGAPGVLTAIVNWTSLVR